MMQIKQTLGIAALVLSLACGTRVNPQEEVYCYVDTNRDGFYDLLRHRDAFGRVTTTPLSREFTKDELQNYPVISVYGYKMNFE